MSVSLDELIGEVRANVETADIFLAIVWADVLLALEELRDIRAGNQA